MRWSELDADRTMWVLPAERVKNGVQHSIPLSRRARSIIADLPRFVGSDLCSPRPARLHVSGYSRFKPRWTMPLRNSTVEADPALDPA